MGRLAYDKKKEKQIMEARKKKLIEAVEQSLGNVSKAARAIGISPVTAYEWMAKDSKLREKIDQIRMYARREIIPDFYEEKLHEQAEKGDTTAIIYGLKSYAPHRGFASDTQFNIAIQNNINFNPVDFFADGGEDVIDVEWEEG